jgi:hypothetical protein
MDVMDVMDRMDLMGVMLWVWVVKPMANDDGSLKRITLHLSELFASFCEVGKDRPKQ